MAIFRISGVWHVGWWNLITSVRLIQVGNNRNDHFRYFLGVRLIKVSFKVNKGNKFGDFGYCLLNRGCPLNTGFTVILFLIRRKLTTEYDQMRLTTITTCNKYNKVYLRIPKVST